MPAVDFHQHLWPESFVAALSRRTEPPRLRGATLELPGARPYEVDLGAHRLENRLSLLDRHEIDVAIVCCQPTLGIERLPAEEADELLTAFHDGVLELAEGSGGRIRVLATEAALDGTIGACVAADRLTGDLTRVERLLDDLERREAVLFVHPGPADDPAGDPPWWPAVVGYTAQMQAAYATWLARGVERWPRLRVVFAILAGGAAIQLERLRSRGVDFRRLVGPNLYLDTSSYGRRAFELCFATFGAGQLVFGSDVPVIEPDVTLRELRGFGQAVENAVLRDNPSRLLS